MKQPRRQLPEAAASAAAVVVVDQQLLLILEVGPWARRLTTVAAFAAVAAEAASLSTNLPCCQPSERAPKKKDLRREKNQKLRTRRNKY